jgi:zinc/manganese transport system substrate-binding protein
MLRLRLRCAAALLCFALLAAPTTARALEVFACEPEWGALAKELGGERADVFVATTARQDPHQIQARPSLIARLRSADLLVCTGAELEIGWLPLLLRQAANPKIQPGTPGYFEAAHYVRLLERPAQLDRAMGDVHGSGNPHIQTDPRNIAAVAAALGPRMQQLDPAGAATIAARAQNFSARWAAATQRWTQQAAPIRGMVVGVSHKSWTYLEDWLGLREAGAIEPKPGIPPGSQHLAQLVGEWPARGVRGILYAAYQDPRAAGYVAQHISVPAIMLPYTVGGTERATDLFGLFDDTVDRLVSGLAGGARAGR